MEHLNQSFTIKYDYKVYFTSALFHKQNTLLHDFLNKSDSVHGARKILFIMSIIEAIGSNPYFLVILITSDLWKSLPYLVRDFPYEFSPIAY